MRRVIASWGRCFKALFGILLGPGVLPTLRPRMVSWTSTASTRDRLREKIVCPLRRLGGVAPAGIPFRGPGKSENLCPFAALHSRTLQQWAEARWTSLLFMNGGRGGVAVFLFFAVATALRSCRRRAGASSTAGIALLGANSSCFSIGLSAGVLLPLR